MDFKKPVREWFSKMKNTTPFIDDFLFRANLKSGIFVGILVSFLEIWLIIAAFAVKHDGTVVHDGFWLLTHVCSYLFLFVVAFSIFLYSTLYLLGYKFDKRIGYAIKVIFSIGSIIFALYITYFSYDKCGSAFAFMTIGIYIFCLFNWHPLANLIMTVVSFGIFFYLQYYKGELTYSILINGFTAWLMLFISGVNVYMQRKSDAFREESLKDLTEQLIEKNKTDALTGLRNVVHFNHAAEIILKSEFTDISKLCFVFVDIENFKNYNEKYGFREGNEFLVKAGNIINEVFTDSLSARVSDDHFVILTKIDEVHEKLSQVRLRIKYEEESINLGIKAGIYTPKTRDCSPSLACDHARYACSSIKKNYAVNFIEYDESMNDDFKKKQYIINNIDNALMHGYIKVYYQPVVWAKDACICGVEALARWNDPNVGFLSPADFIPILEEYHMIHKLDMFILEVVCKDLSEANDPELPKLPVSINFSRLDFDHTDIFAEVERCIKKYGINKQMIHIEITESALHDSDEKFRKTLDMFRSNGYALWLDDFGSGYSGLNVLKEFNFDTMKIDMKFLYRFSENKKAQPILTSIVDLANKIGMNTLTEGVETEEVFNFLRSIGCQRLQGYFFGKPMPKEELAACIKAGKFVVDKK